MPRPTSAGACLALVTCTVLAGCASHHVETHVPAGLTFSCDQGGSLAIRFARTGYQPDSNVRALVNGQPSDLPVARSSAEVDYGGRTIRMVAEHSDQGLRYRSEVRHDGHNYLIWTQRGAAPYRPERWTASEAPSAEDVRLGERAALMPVTEEEAEGRPVATCRRDGRQRGAAAAHAH